jgi:DEAD/DEAH box helicase domain-containing protein
MSSLPAPPPASIFHAPSVASVRDGGALAERLQRRYGERITGVIRQPARPGRLADLPEDLPANLARAASSALQPPGEAWAGARRPAARRGGHPDRLGQDALLQPAGAAARSRTAQGAVPVPDQGAGAGPGRRAAGAEPRRRARRARHTFDGDTPGDARQAIRLHGDIVVSNPDMLHQAILPHHTKWAQFFENLRYVVIDEMHSYRGVFGSHVANVLRRLQRICAFYGVARSSSSARRPSATRASMPRR